MRAKKIHIGCSSYNNSEWKNIFYPEELPRSKWFAFYTAHFWCYELNTTFYKFPTVRSLASWDAKTPESFSFSVKAPKTITHIKKFEDCTAELETFYRTCSEGLGKKLKCLLFQLPPSFSYTKARLELLIENLDPNYNNVVEFRNESWWISEVFESFAQAGITFCSPSYPKLPSENIATSSLGYIRLHGNPKLFYSEYPKAELEKIRQQVQEKKFDEVFIFFNNTASTAGIRNAIEMKSIVEYNESNHEEQQRRGKDFSDNQTQ